jgi:hypothetical protein
MKRMFELVVKGKSNFDICNELKIKDLDIIIKGREIFNTAFKKSSTCKNKTIQEKCKKISGYETIEKCLNCNIWELNNPRFSFRARMR